MGSYLAIFKIRTKVLFQYRAATLAGIATQLFWGVIRLLIFRAFYAQSAAQEPISLSQAITFSWIGQALLGLLPWTIDKEIEAQVKSGHVAYEMVRPLDLYGLWFARSLAMRFVPTLFRCFPIFLISGVWFGLTAPLSWLAGGVFCLSAFLALFLSSAITTLVIISLFWTLSGEGILRLLPYCTVLLSGMVIPLPLFPQWMQPFLSIQPFRGVIDIPCRLYTGVIPMHEALYYLAFQLAWTGVLILCGKWLMQRAMRRFIIQGG